MGYQVNLNTLRENPARFDYSVGSDFFSGMESSLVEKGEVDAHVELSDCGNDSYRLKLRLAGWVEVPCDYCLEPMKLTVEDERELKVRFGDPAETTADCVVVSRRDGRLDMAPLIYDYVVLAIPLRHVHEEGECNVEMAERLAEFMVTESKGEEDGEDAEHV